MFKILHRIFRTAIVFVLGAFTLFFLGTAWFVFGIHLDDRTIEPELAFWMEHSWSTGTQNDFNLLAQKLDDLPVTNLYFHVGPLNPVGGLADDLNVFTPGLQALGTTNYAWIGQIRSQIDLDDPNVRQRIIESAEWTISKGFDGVHLDIEPVRKDDEGFFTLLTELREALPDNKISVAMDEWQPHLLSKFMASTMEIDIESYWTIKQVERTAELADQIVVMTYDTSFHDPNLYSWWVEQQTIALSKTMPEDVELFIGIPSYDEGQSLDPETENVQTGITGFLKGVKNLRSQIENISGLAIYAYWEMDNDEWTLLHNL